MNFFIPLVFLFWTGNFLNEVFFWLIWVGFARLCFLYQSRRHGNFLKGFLLPCWGLFLAIYAACFCWIASQGDALYLLAVSLFSIIFPLLFLTHHLITSRVRSRVFNIAAMFVIFFAVEFLVSQSQALESGGLDLFFQPPAAFLCVMKFISFKVWSAWIFTTCFAIGCWTPKEKIRSLVPPAILIAGLALLIILAQAQNKSERNEADRILKVALVQLNLPYAAEWRLTHSESVKDKYREMILKAARGNPDLIVFPLYTIPGDIYRKPAFLQELARMAKCPVLIAGDAPIQPGDENLYHGFMKLAFLYSPEGTIIDTYQAFAAIPFTGLIVKKAERYHVIQGPYGKFGVLICFEDMIPSLARKAARDGAEVLIALSNPGQFQDTPLPYYHLFQDQIRAAETGLPLIRVSSNGYTALIARTGKIVQRTDLDTEDILQVQIPLRTKLDSPKKKLTPTEDQSV